MPLITLGANTSLIIKIPSRGDTQWAADFQTEFALPIANHDHTGNGKGKKITTAALEDNAVSGAKIAPRAINPAEHISSGAEFLDYPGVPSTTNVSFPAYLEYTGSGVQWESVETLASGVYEVGTGGNDSSAFSFTDYPVVHVPNTENTMGLDGGFGFTRLNQTILLEGGQSVYYHLDNCTVYSRGTVTFHGDLRNCKVIAQGDVIFTTTTIASTGTYNTYSDLEVINCDIKAEGAIKHYVHAHVDGDLLDIDYRNSRVHCNEFISYAPSESSNRITFDAGSLFTTSLTGEGFGGENGFKLNCTEYQPGAAAGFTILSMYNPANGYGYYEGSYDNPNKLDMTIIARSLTSSGGNFNDLNTVSIEPLDGFGIISYPAQTIPSGGTSSIFVNPFDQFKYIAAHSKDPVHVRVSAPGAGLLGYFVENSTQNLYTCILDGNGNGGFLMNVERGNDLELINASSTSATVTVSIPTISTIKTR